MMKVDELTEGKPEDEVHYTNMMEFISNSDMTVDSNYKTACNLIDIESFIDYYALQIYIARCSDWPSANYALWRTREPENSRYGDTKWRWMLFDVNSGGLATDSNTFVEDDTLQMVLESDSLFASLFQNKEFQKKFADRILYIGKTLLSEDQCTPFIDSYFSSFGELLQKSNLRVFNNPRTDEQVCYIRNMKLFFADRYDVVCNLLKTHIDHEILIAVQ